MDIADFTGLFEWLPIGAYRIHPDGRLMRVNSALARLNGFETEAELLQVCQRPQAEWYVQPGRLADLQRQVMALGRLDKVESEVKRLKTGERIWVREHLRLVRAADGQVAFYEGTVEDITRVHTVQTALQLTLENAGAGMALIEADGAVSYHNRLTLQLLDLPYSMGAAGLSTQAVLDYQLANGHYDDHPEAAPAVLWDVPSRPPADILDVTQARQYLRRTHKGRVLQVTTQPLGAGRAVRTYLDVTQLVLSERTLAATSRHLQTVLDSVAQGIISIDADDRVVLVNARARELLDLPDAVLNERATFWDLIRYQHARGDFGPQGQLADPITQQFLQTGIAPKLSDVPKRYRRQRADGRWLEVQTVHSPGGGLVRTYSDVTEEVAAQLALKTQHLHLQALVETHPDRIWAKDIAGRYTLVNAAQAAFHGLPVADFLGRNDIELFGEERGKTYQATDVMPLVESAPFVEEHTATEPSSGRLLYYKITKVALRNAQGELVGTMGAARDVTMYRDAQRTAEQAARAKSSFLATMSHELRTPLNAVLGMAHLLADTSLDTQQQEFVDIIRRSGDQLLALINDVLDYSRVDSGRLTLEQIELNLSDCVHDAAETVARAAVAKGLEITAWVDPALPPSIVGDPMRLKQVLLNLLSNAVKFTAHGMVSLRAEADGPAGMRIAVKDTGIGMTAEGIGRLFEVFSQVDASTTRRFGGTGLGLAISRRLVEHMGGRVEVQSMPGQGSTFVCWLPIKPAASGLAAGSTTPLPARHVAVLSARSHHRGHFVEQLQALGHTVYPLAASATLPLDWVALGLARAPDAVVLDWPSLTDPQRAAWQAALVRWSGPTQVVVAAPVDQYPDRASAWGQGQWVKGVFLPMRRARLAEAMAASAGLERPGTVRAADRAPTPQASQSQLRVLMAEDNTINQRVATLILSKLGYAATVVDDGQKAVAALQTAATQGTPFDVVLMDVQMPVLSGTEATAELRRLLPPAQQPWIIAMTANAMDSDRQACLEAGMDDFVSKPIEPPLLARALASARKVGQRHSA